MAPVAGRPVGRSGRRALSLLRLFMLLLELQLVLSGRLLPKIRLAASRAARRASFVGALVASSAEGLGTPIGDKLIASGVRGAATFSDLSVSVGVKGGGIFGDTFTVIGYGSLLSQKSARSTFPEFHNFRLARVHGHRRVFRHPSGLLFQHGLVPEGTLEMGTLSVESHKGSSIVVSVFEIPKEEHGRLQRREAAYNLMWTPYHALDAGPEETPDGEGLMCVPLNHDNEYIERWGQKRFDDAFVRHGIGTIWGWGPDSGILPCPVYLRHCVLSAEKAGEHAYESFLDDTFLVDRKTSIREYLLARPEVWDATPPPSLAERYGGA